VAASPVLFLSGHFFGGRNEKRKRVSSSRLSDATVAYGAAGVGCRTGRVQRGNGYGAAGVGCRTKEGTEGYLWHSSEA
jgi:hypothetical protein